MSPPAELRRLFPDFSDRDISQLEPTSFVIGRILEEGDTTDLRWLCARSGEAQLAAWLEARGDRQLSRRSRAFWSLLLASPGEAARRPDAQDNPLWPF